MDKAAQDHACHRGNAPGQHLVAITEEHQPVQRVRHRRDKAEGLDTAAIGRGIDLLQRLGVLGHQRQMAAQPPGRRHAQADQQPAQQYDPAALGTGPGIEGQQQQQAPQTQTQHAAQQRQGPGHMAGQPFGQQGRAREFKMHAVQPAHPRHGGNALERGKSGHAHDQQHHQRLEAAAAQPGQIPGPAPRCQHHAAAKQQPSRQGRQPQQAAAGIQGIAHLQLAPQRQRREAQHAHGDGHAPLARPPPVLQIHHIADGTHGAKAGLAHHEAQHGGQQQNGHQNGGRQGFKLGRTHAGIGRRGPASRHWHIPQPAR